VIVPGKRPRRTLTPSLAMKDGQAVPRVCGAGGDTRIRNLLQCFLNVVEFGMNVQQAVERRTSRVIRCAFIWRP